MPRSIPSLHCTPTAWEIRWTDDGRSHRRSTGTLVHADALKAYARFILGEASTPTAPTVREVLAAYDLHSKPRVKDWKSLTRICATLDRMFGHLPCGSLGDLKACDVANYGVARGIDPGTARKELGVLIAAINHAVRIKLMTADQRPHIERPAEPPPRDRVLSKEEAVRLGKACKDEGAACFAYFVILLKTAARRTSVLNLTWDRVDFTRKAINFAEPGETPTRKRRGWVPMSSQLEKVLRDYRKVAEHPLVPLIQVDKVFRTSPRRAFERAVVAAGLPGVSPHVLRHTWATWAAQDGVSMVDIAGVLHDSIATVEKRYLHHCPQHLRKAVER